jgi:hypothetical protein
MTVDSTVRGDKNRFWPGNSVGTKRLAVTYKIYAERKVLNGASPF